MYAKPCSLGSTHHCSGSRDAAPPACIARVRRSHAAARAMRRLQPAQSCNAAPAAGRCRRDRGRTRPRAAAAVECLPHGRLSIPGPDPRGRNARGAARDRRRRGPGDPARLLRAVPREAARPRAGLARADQRPLRVEQPHSRRRDRSVPEEARRVARSLRQDAVRPLRAPRGRGPAAQGPAARRRRVARHAARAHRVRPRPPGGAEGRDQVPRPLHAPRDGRARPARRGAAGRPGAARYRQPVRGELHPRRGRLLRARRVSQSARLAAVHGARALRPHAGDQQALHLAQPLPGRPRHPAGDQGRAARAARTVPPTTRTCCRRSARC